MAKIYSDKVRQFDCAQFKGLNVGERFRFASEVDCAGSGMKTGVAVKISARKYRYEADGMESQVGSTAAVVLRVDAGGEPIRVGHWAPSLRD